MTDRANHNRLTMWLVATCLLIATGCGTSSKLSEVLTKTDSLERKSEKGPVALLVRVTPSQPRLSDNVEMELQVTFPAGVEITPPTFGQAVGDFVIRDYTEKRDNTAKRDSTGNRDNHDPKADPLSDKTTTRRFLYKLEPASSGRHLIRAMAVEFIDNRPLSEQKGVKSLIESEPIEINVTSEFGDGVPSLSDLEPMVPPRPIDQSSSTFWGLIATLIAIAIGLVIWFRWRRQETASVPVQKSPQEIAHAAFAALMAEDLPAKGQFKEFYLRLTGIVRYFIEGTTGLHAPEQTTEEFLREMRSREVFSAERSLRLKEFLEAADMVKYAGQQPDAEQISLSIDRAREFVDYQPSVLVAASTAAGEA